MTDRELLEAAAKAAGLTTSHKWNAQRLEMTPPVPSLVVHRDGELVSTGWNPLADDGDALRLAVKLGIDVCIDTAQERPPQTQAIGFAGDGSDTVDAIEFHRDDPYAATRRAIVLAAASIGKTGEPT